MFKNALVSVSDKTGLVEFLTPLVQKGLRVVSTGGTARHLKENGLEIIEVKEQTGFPEVMNGRVKTLHPKIHMALLAREGNLEDQEVLDKYDIVPFDLVIGNLYPFEKAVKQQKPIDELIEFIDIGGPSFLRASAKNHERILCLCDPKDYKTVSEVVLSGEEVSQSYRRKMASKVFSHTALYDSLISHELLKGDDEVFNSELSLSGRLVKELRYGENPHQKAFWFEEPLKNGWQSIQVLQGKELSYNNLLDLDSAVKALTSFEDGFTCVSVKHTNPCGIASDEFMIKAIRKSLKADPVSVFGGIVAVNGNIDLDAAKEFDDLFFECLVARGFTEEAREHFSKKKNLRLILWPDLGSLQQTANYKSRSISGGFLLQTEDRPQSEWGKDWKVHGEEPDESLKKELLFCWKTCAYLKSNAIAISNSQQTIGLGMGQVNRVDAVDQAISRAPKISSNWRKNSACERCLFSFS